MLEHTRPERQRKPERQREPDQPTCPHREEFEDPVERTKTAFHKADERARRTKRAGAAGARGGTSQD